MSGNEPSGSLVGTPVAWTASADGHGASPVYQFRVGPVGAASQVARDFSTSASFTWDPLQEGDYQVSVIVKDGFDAATGEGATASYTANSRVSGSNPVVSPTSNPLVALYSVPASSSGGSVTVQFRLMGSRAWKSTASEAAVPGKSTNILVANLLPKRTYQMRDVTSDGTTSAPLKFKAGALPKKLKFPTFTVQKTTAKADLAQDTVLHFGINAPAGTVDTIATNRAGQVSWYYDPVANAPPSYAVSVVPGGTVLLFGNLINIGGAATILREVDLAGQAVRETNVDAVNAQLAALGQHPISSFSHDAQRLPNGDTAILATTPRTVDLNGKPTAYDGDMVIVLDSNFQVAWTWDPFTWLDTNRLPTLGEGPGDWTHANSIAWSPTDGDLLVSLRNQDWVLKIDYANGTGDGHIVWRLGAGGDFAINSPFPDPWFSHQHDARYVNDNTLTLFDDGNVRQAANPKAHSRGQELVLDEANLTATLVVNADVGNYASALGSAQRLPNGNFDFDSGFAQQTIELLPTGAKAYVQKMNLKGYQYRSYIVSNLYGV